VDTTGVTLGAVNFGALNATGTVTAKASTLGNVTVGIVGGRVTPDHAVIDLTGSSIGTVSLGTVNVDKSATITGSADMESNVQVDASATATSLTVDYTGSSVQDDLTINGGALTKTITVTAAMGGDSTNNSADTADACQACHYNSGHRCLLGPVF
jgi:hypothetical protein